MTNEATKLLREVCEAWGPIGAPGWSAGGPDRFNDAIDAARTYLSREAPAAEALMPEWISVRDRMPDGAQMVLMHIPYSHAGPVVYGWYDSLNTQKWMMPLAGSKPWGEVRDEVTHWIAIRSIPLPATAPSPAPAAEASTLAQKMRAVDLAIAALEGEEIAWPDHKILHTAASVARRYKESPLRKCQRCGAVLGHCKPECAPAPADGLREDKTMIHQSNVTDEQTGQRADPEAKSGVGGQTPRDMLREAVERNARILENRERGVVGARDDGELIAALRAMAEDDMPAAKYPQWTRGHVCSVAADWIEARAEAQPRDGLAARLNDAEADASYNWRAPSLVRLLREAAAALASRPPPIVSGDERRYEWLRAQIGDANGRADVYLLLTGTDWGGALQVRTAEQLDSAIDQAMDSNG